jgi:hypothetical protein
LTGSIQIAGRTDHFTFQAKDVRECEAELTAYLVKSSLGQTQNLEHSRAYIQGWMQPDTKKDIRFGKVFSAADQILKAGRLETQRPMQTERPLERVEHHSGPA